MTEQNVYPVRGPKQLSREHVLLTRDCDALGHLRAGIMMELLQEAAGMHSDACGHGRQDLLPRGIVWVLTGLHVQADRWPKLGERITVNTWHMPVQHMFFPRCFTITDEEGQVLIRASSLWVLMDVNTRSMIRRPDSSLTAFPDNSDRTPALSMPRAPEEADGPQESLTFMPVYTDFDVNMHVNNTRYMDWCCNALGLETLSKDMLREFTVQYIREIRPGQSVVTVLRRGPDGAFSFSGKADGERAFDIGGALR